MSQAGTSIAQLLSALQRRAIPLPFEMGTFLVLEAVEQVLTLEATEHVPAFCLAPPDEIWVSDQGEVSVEATRTASEADACRGLVMLLGDLLVRSAPGVPPMLLEIVEHGPSDAQWTLMRLRDDLEAALVPLNRAATRRVLARLLREVRRDVDRSAPAPTRDAHSLEDELDDLLGAEAPTSRQAQQPVARARPGPARDDPTADVELSELRLHEPEIEPAPQEAAMSQPRKASKPRAVARAKLAVERESEREGPALSLATDTLDDFEQNASGGGGGHGLRVGLGLVVLAAALGAGYLLLGQKASRSALGLSPTPDSNAAPVAPRPAAPEKPKVGELRVTSTPGRAQVLMLVGTAPALATKLPTGVAYEFVALADGFAPSRAIVPPDADWPEQAGEPRYELALQLNEASPQRAQELGPTRLPQDVGTPKATLGSVRVVTSPPGAKVYQLIGFTPDVRVENQPIAGQTELLVYLNGHALQRVVVGESDWKQQASGLVAELDLKLPPKRK